MTHATTATSTASAVTGARKHALLEIRGQYFVVPYTNTRVIERYALRHRVIVHDYHVDGDTSEAPVCSLRELDMYL